MKDALTKPSEITVKSVILRTESVRGGVRIFYNVVVQLVQNSDSSVQLVSYTLQ